MKRPLALAVVVVTLLAPAAWLSVLAARHGEPLAHIATMAGIGVLGGVGILVLVGLPALFVARALGKPLPRTVLRPDERPIVELRANHFLGVEGRGGALLVTSKRLLFHPHRFNVQLAPVALELSGIDAIKPWLTGFRVVARGRTERFVVSNRTEAMALLEELVRTPEENRLELVDDLARLPGSKRIAGRSSVEPDG